MVINTKLEEKQRRRFKMLEYIYQKSDADVYSYINWDTMNKDLLDDDSSLDAKEIRKTFRYLVGEGLVEGKTLGSVGITHPGIREYESAIREPDKETEHFAPINILQVQHMENSQVQQGTIHSSQFIQITSDQKKDIEEFINLLKNGLEDIELEVSDATEIDAEINTVEAQLKSSRPKSPILKESIQSIKRILEGAAGSFVAAKLLEQIPAILSILG